MLPRRACGLTFALLLFVVELQRLDAAGGEGNVAFCATADCEARSGPQDRQEAAQDWALRHAGLTGHRLFRRVYTDHAEVTRAGARGR
ncbi:hypothetical protein [Streptomyces sp. C10-9-1]|uniref:DUF7848 domain-containing protein n=1 Tax=Streptomyces sp. C10-9-1 TaxID=1859285 RepID=UPI003D725855